MTSDLDLARSPGAGVAALLGHRPRPASTAGRMVVARLAAHFDRRRVGTEMVGVGAALLCGLVVLAHLAVSPRAWVLFYDGDSLLFPLVHASLAAHQAQQWVLSSPLFLPEALVYLGVAATGLPVKTTLIIDGLTNWLALYTVVRLLAAQIRIRPSAAVRASVVAVVAVSAAAICESSSSHDGLEPASLLATTTYYSGTVIATITALALLTRAIRTPRTGQLVGLAAATGFATFSNPLFIGWATIPMLAATAITLACGVPLSTLTKIGLTVATATGASLALRIPLGRILVQDDTAKIRPDLAAESGRYYADLLHNRLTTTSGQLELALALLLLITAAIALVLTIQLRWITGTVIAGAALLTPLLVTTGAISLGTFAARYLQPVTFTPPLALLPLALLAHRRKVDGPVNALPLRISAGLLAGVLAGSSLPTLVQASTQRDPDIGCVAGWLSRNPETGAGQYWTIRALQTYATTRPDQLLQIDTTGTGNAWLTNTTHLTDTPYSFTITDPTSAPFTGPIAGRAAARIHCGRYVINDYRPVTFTTGTPHH